MNEALAQIDPPLPEVREDEAAIKPPSANWRPLLYLLVFSPLIGLGFAVANFAVDMLLLDDWERGEMWRRYYAGTLDFAYLYSPHIEHRSLFPRLITLAYGLWFGGDVRLEIWTIYALVAANCLLCFRLLRLSLGKGVALWPTAFLINLLLCCPLQYPDFLWASMVAFMLPFTCLLAILVAAVSKLPNWLKFVLTVLLAEIATHSFSQGLVLWPVAICLPLFSPQGFGAMRGRLLYALAMLSVAVLTLIPYFTWHFETTSHISHTYGIVTGERISIAEKLRRALEDPREVQEYFFKSLGDPLVRAFSRDPPGAARDVGRCVFALFAAANFFMLWRRKDRDAWRRLLPWVAAGWFSLSVALMLGIGRSVNAADRSTMPRYIPMTLFMVIALVAVGAFAVCWWSARARDRQERARRAAVGWAAGGALAVLLANLWSYGQFKMAAWHNARLEARAALVYINLFEPQEGGRIDNTVEFARAQARVMSKHGLLHPPLAQRWGFEPFMPRARRLGGGEAELSLVRRRADEVEVMGFALLPSGRVADGALVSIRRSAEDDWQVIGFAELRSAHVPAKLFLHDAHFGAGHDLSSPQRYAVFNGHAQLGAAAGPGELQLLCWALDAEFFEAYPIGEPVTLPASPDP